MKNKSLISLATGLIMLWTVGEANALYFTVPYDADLYLRSIGGEAAASTEFGIGNSIDNYTPYFTNLPGNPNPDHEVFTGSFLAGTTIDFYQKTEWGYGTYWAFSNYNDRASLYAFSDINNSLGLGGSSLQQTTVNTWVLHLDDAASFNIDDDDNDILFQIRLSATPNPQPLTIPEPSIIFLMGSGLVCLVGVCRKKKA